MIALYCLTAIAATGFVLSQMGEHISHMRKYPRIPVDRGKPISITSLKKKRWWQ